MIIALSGVLVAVYGVAAAAKLSPAGRAAHRRTLAALWPSAGPAVAAVSVAAECAVVVGLLAGTVHPAPLVAGFVAATALALGYAGAHVHALRADLAVPCSCFGRTERVLGRAGLLRAVLLAAAGAAGVSLAMRDAPPVAAATAVAAAVAGVVVGLLLVHLEDAADLLRAPTAGGAT